MRLFPIVSQKMIPRDSIIFHIGLRHEGRSMILKTSYSFFSVWKSLRGNSSGPAICPIDQGSIRQKHTLLDPEYKNNLHIMRRYTISYLQFHFTHLKS